MNLLFRSVIICSLTLLFFAEGDTVSAQMADNISIEESTLESSWQDTVPQAWEGIDLTGSRSKAPEQAVSEGGAFPFWIPIVAVGAGVGAYFLLRDDDDDDDPEFELMDDQVSVSCEEPVTFDPPQTILGPG